MPEQPPLPIEQSALLVIDVQDSFKARPVWERRGNPEFEANVDRLVQGYRAAGLPVIFILHTDDDAEFQTTSPHFKLMDFLVRQEDEPLLVKTTRNAFSSTNLQEILHHAGVRRLAITGIQTEQCCETTARVAADLGYDVDFVTAATQTFPIAHPDLSEELSPAEIFRRTEYVLRGRFARVPSVESLLEELHGAEVPCGV